jgi:hypothetical protein
MTDRLPQLIAHIGADGSNPSVLQNRSPIRRAKWSVIREVQA